MSLQPKLGMKKSIHVPPRGGFMYSSQCEPFVLQQYVRVERSVRKFETFGP